MMEDSLDLVDQKENVLNEAPKSANKKGLNSRSSPRSSTQQNSIMSMFAKMSNKRKSSAEGEPSKKLKREPNTDRSSLLESPLVGPEVGDLKPELGDAEKAVRCNCCLQYPDDPDVHNLIADPEDSQEEFVTLTQPLLSIYEDNQSASLEERVQHKITNFSVYGECKHLCSFDEGLIEKNKALYFRGYVKPIYCEDSSITDGMAFPTKSMGPIVEWFTSGFDGMFAIVGFSTAYADYFLMEASDEYKPLMSVVREKVFVSNLVISHLLDEPFSTYSDLLDKLQSAERPPGVTCSLNEDTVIRHAQFVIDQVQSFDAADDKETEDRIIDTQCIADLMNLSGATRKVHPAGAKSKIRSRITKKKKTGHETMSYATTTPLVARVFNEMFKTEINKTTGLRDCGSCAGCEAETEIKKCNNPQQVDDVYEYNGDDENNATKYNKSKAKAEEISVIGKPGKTCDGTKYYNKLAWMDTEIKVGDCVFVRDSEHEIGIVEYIYVSPKNKPQLHLHWLLPGTETVLGELADPRELFLIDECDDVSAKRINYPIKLIFRDTSSDWSECGGDEAGRSPVNPSAETIYFYQKWYNAEMARFEDVPQIPKADLTECTSCNSDTRKRMEMVFGKRVEGTKDCYESVAYYGNTYKVGGCVYLPPDLYKYKYKRRSNGKDTIDMSQFKDRTKYPEFYRRTNTYVKGSNDECPPPYLVGFISAISRGKSDDPESVHLDINKLYRPENTHLSDDEVFSSDLNLLYWSSEESRVTLSSACGSSLLFYLSNQQANDISLIDKLFERQYFYITKAYDGIAKNFIKIPEEICNRYTLTSMPSNPLPKPLRCLDVFAGCGGLSAGLHQAGAAVSHWAIEKVDEAAKAYALNAPDCQVFTEDCNVLLKMVMEGKKETRLGQKLPQKGEVEMLCGGPPCQGFSGMNRFNHREYSRFKNSLIASYLSYADYYRPKFFILENVRNFVSYKKSGILKMALRCLIAMGYQCTFGVMQAGCYGVAQTRRRAIIFAAAPGEVLPRYPEPRHVFAPKAMALTVMINEQKYLPIEQNLHSAPFRTVTVRDCMSDLPVIENGSKISEMKYTKARITHFQRLIRGGNTKVNDHICKNMNALVCTRMSYVPTIPGADWRLLPNIEVKLRDGTRTKKLKYTHNDPEARARDPKAGFRGVCSCAEGDKCEPSDRQFETLIPWCLPHTGNRHNHWAGLYGRLEWDGFFSTTVTNPEPMGKQGRVLHPEQHRVVSVRECARSQGFPDTFKFYGEVLDKHRQVGNAVPPPLGKALGLEVIKARNSEK